MIRRRHHPRRDGDDGSGPAIHAAEAFVHAGYPLVGRGVADRRTGWTTGRGGPSDRSVCALLATAATEDPHQPQRGGTSCLLGRPQGGVSLQSVASRPTICAWMGPSRAPVCPRCWSAWTGLAERASPAGRQRLPCRRWEPASADPVRRQFKDDELQRAEALGADILRLCVEVGGVLTGEHGVGIEKRDLMPVMFDETDLAQQIAHQAAPSTARQLLNPGKMFPTTASLRRLWAAPRLGREAPLPRPAALLMTGALERDMSAAAQRRPNPRCNEELLRPRDEADIVRDILRGRSAPLRHRRSAAASAGWGARPTITSAFCLARP